MKYLFILFLSYFSISGNAANLTPYFNSSCQPDPNLPTELRPDFVYRVPEVTFGLGSALFKLPKLKSDLMRQLEENHSSIEGCSGGCRKIFNNEVEIVYMAKELEPSRECPSQPELLILSPNEKKLFRDNFQSSQSGISKEFTAQGNYEECQEKARIWAQELIQAKSELGKYLDETRCKSPCSFSAKINISLSQFADNPNGCRSIAQVKLYCQAPKKSDITVYGSIKNRWRCDK